MIYLSFFFSSYWGGGGENVSCTIAELGNSPFTTEIYAKRDREVREGKKAK